MEMEPRVPKRRHIKFRRRGITQKKTYNIQNTVKVLNQENNTCLSAINPHFGDENKTVIRRAVSEILEFFKSS